MLSAAQNDVAAKCYAEWAKGHRNVMPVCPTGFGKTEISKFIISNHNGPGIAMAHRSVLVGQMSTALARAGVQHDIIAQKSVIRTIVSEHMDEVGRNFFNPSSQFKVASVDTLPGRIESMQPWARRVSLGVTDEGHHVLKDNKWGKACGMFPSAYWLLPTATPERADGRGLGRHADGIVDALVEGPGMKWCIDNGYLTNFRIRAPFPSDLDLSDVTIGANGEYNLKQVRKAVHRSGKIIGNIVDTYIENTKGLLGIAFAVDIEHATALTAEFNKKGIPCELITADHTEEERRAILRRYRNRETWVLVNVDLFGEGFDLPAIEVVMFGRPTASYALYAQQFGRGLRLGISRLVRESWEYYSVATRLQLIAQSSKPIAYIHDHVGNIVHFNGPPTIPRIWSLDSRSNRTSGPSDAIPMRVCLNKACLEPFERFYTECPYCRTPVPPPPTPKLPVEIDGDLTLYTEDMLMKMFGVHSVSDALKIQPQTFLPIPTGLSAAAIHSKQGHHRHKLAQQARLGQLMKLVMPPTLSERENMRKFFLQFGTDVVAARLLNGNDTQELADKIETKLKG